MKKRLYRGSLSSLLLFLLIVISQVSFAATEASFCDETVPKDNDQVYSNATFTKGWKLKNTGSTTWTSSYCLRYVSDNVPVGTLSTSQNAACVSGTVANGASYWFYVPMKAPSAPGTGLREDWKFTGPDAGTLIPVKGTVNCGAWNGKTFNSVWVKVNVVNRAPSVALQSPNNGATGQATNLTLRWSGSDPDGDAITNYYVQLDDNADFSSPLWGQWMGNNLTYWQPSGSGVILGYNKIYYWRVGAYDGKDVGNYSTTWSFTTSAPPNSRPNDCTLASPGDGTTGQALNVTLSWNCTDPDNDIVDYYLQLDDNSDFSSPLKNGLLGSANKSWNPAANGITLNYSTTYYWRVYARDEHGEISALWTRWSFTTAAPPNQSPTLGGASVNPAGGVQNSTTFTWQVKYTDADGDAPTKSEILIQNPQTGQWWTFQMTPGAGSYAAGRTYSYAQPLISIGTYQYKFRFSDGINPVVESPVYQGPVTSSPDANAEFVGETVPDGTRKTPGQTFVKTWTLKNLGAAVWNDNFFLRRRPVANPFSLVSSVAVSGTVLVGGNNLFSVNMKAPNNQGNYREEWEFVASGGQIIPVTAPDGSWTSDRITVEIVVGFPDQPPAGLPPADIGNKDFGAINSKILALAGQNDIPPIVLQAIAYQESGWQHYWPSDLGLVSYCNGNQKYDRVKGKAKLNFNIDANCVFQSVDIGLMQVSVPLSDQMSNISKVQYANPSAASLAQEVSGSWEKNLEAAVQKLNTKWVLSAYGSDCDKDKSILENWYYAIAWYNGEGARAYNYVGNVYDYMSGGSSMGQTLDPMVTKVQDVASPRIIPGFSATIQSNPAAPNEVYTLLDLANFSGRIHRWTGADSYVDITQQVKNGTCMAAAGETVKPPSKVVGVNVSQSGNQVTISWRQNPQDEDVTGYYVLWAPTDESGKLIGEVQRSNMIAGASNTRWSSQFNPGNYRVSVFASGSISDGLPSNGVLFIVTDVGTRPGKVTGVGAAVSGRDVKVTWDAIPNASYYNLFWKKEGDATFKGVAGIRGTEYNTTDIPDGSFVAKVTACHEETVLWLFTTKVECGDQSAEVQFSVPEPGFAINCTKLHNNDDPLAQSINVGELKHYCFALPSNVKVLTVQMGGKGLHDDPQDADLYVKSGSPVIVGDLGKKNDLINPVVISPWLDGSLESVTVYNPAAGKWYVAVHGSADMNNIKSPDKALNFFIKLHYHGAGREGVPEGLELNPTGISRIFPPVDSSAGSWYSYETKCADEAFDANPVPDACSPAVTIDGTSGNGVVTPDKSCYATCRSSAHKKGDWDSLDFNLPDDADKGKELYSSFAGTVIFKDSYDGYGNEVVIQSDIDSNFAARYGHMAGWAKGLESGQYIKAGKKIGTIGKSGPTPSNHLHFSLHKNLVMNLASGKAMDETALKKELKGSLPSDQYYSAFIPLAISDYPAVPQELRATVAQSKCPVNMDVVDDQGRRVGPGAFGTLNMDIPGGDYMMIHAANRNFEEISLPDTGPKDYRFNIAGNDEGEFNIAVSAPDEAKKLYNNVVYTHEPVDEGIFAELDLSKIATSYSLVIKDGTDSFIPEPPSSTENAQQFLDSSPAITVLSSRTLVPGEVLTISGSGFGNPGDDSPGEIEIISGHDLYRQFDIQTWNDTEITARLSGENIKEGRYQLRLKIYPSRVSSNKATLDIIAADSTPVLQSAKPVYVLENQSGIAANFLGKGFTAAAKVTVGGQPVSDIYVAGADHIQGTLPMLNAGSYAVVVDNGNGKQSVGSVTIESLPAAGDLDQDGLSNEDEFQLGLRPDVPDSDDDGVSDGTDAFPGDPSETKDSDSDGVGDNADICPRDPTKITSAGICGCGKPETDSDSDGAPNCTDICPLDPAKIALGACGCGRPDADITGDGLPDCPAEGSLNAAFNGTGKTTTDITGNGSNDYATSTLIQPDGKVIVLGHTDNDTNSANFDWALVRYNKDGSLDQSFGNGGIATNAISGGSDFIMKALLDPLGRILVVGGGGGNFIVARYAADGILDSSFGSSGVATIDFGGTDFGNAIALQADGKIVVAGYTNVDGKEDFALARLTDSGALDAAFGSAGKVITPVLLDVDLPYALIIQKDGRIIAGGFTRDNLKAYRFGLVRYDANGALDSAFDGDGKSVTSIGATRDGLYALAIQSSGKIIAGGYTQSGNNYDFALVRYDIDGSVDATFGADGVTTTDFGYGDGIARGDVINSLVLQDDDKILAIGQVAQDFAVARYTADGVLDQGYGGMNGEMAGLTKIDMGGIDGAFGAYGSNGEIALGGSSGGDFAVAMIWGPKADLRLTMQGAGALNPGLSKGFGLKSILGSSVGAEKRFNLNVAAYNAGPDEAVGVSIVIELPDFVEVVSAKPGQGECLHEATGGLTCSLGNIAAGKSVRVDIEILSNGSGTFKGKAYIAGRVSDIDLSNNDASFEFTSGGDYVADDTGVISPAGGDAGLPPQGGDASPTDAISPAPAGGCSLVPNRSQSK